MKKIAFTLGAVFLIFSSAFAGLPRTAITSLGISVYGMYTSPDPTCQTGLLATLPLSATPQTVDLVTNPTFGNGPVPASIKCVVIVMKNQIAQSWAAGSYMTTSTIGGGGTYADSNCNAGSGTPFVQKICRTDVASFPEKIVQDAAQVGLTLSTGACPASPTGNEIVAAYISTYAACSGDATVDPPACSGMSHADSFDAPTAPGDTSKGVKLASPPDTHGSIVFVIDPTNVIGGCGSVGAACIATSSGNCGGNNPPLFSLRN